MPWGWECRAKLIKQLPAKSTQRRGKPDIRAPGPQKYDPPEIFCGKGYSHIKRSPAFTFGHLTPPEIKKPAVQPTAPSLDCRGLTPKGRKRITHSVVTPHLELPGDSLNVPGPGAYQPRNELRYKRPPAYSMRPAAHPPYQPWDQWTPSPNMYHPPINRSKKPPAFTLGNNWRDLKPSDQPGPGEHDPNFKYVKKNTPEFSFGPPFRAMKPPKIPAPNAYCEKKYMVSKRSIPAPTFGIRHSEYIGVHPPYLKQSSLEKIEE